MKTSFFWRALFYLAAAIIVVYTIFPFYWAFHTSLIGNPGSLPIRYVAMPPSGESYGQVFKNATFVRALLNSTIVAIGATTLSLVLGSLAACAIGRYPFRGRMAILVLILAMTMFPQISILGGLYTLIRRAGLIDTHAGLIVSYLLTILPFTVWVLTNFFRSFPRELEESAYVDGASPFQTFWRILLPLSAPGLVTTGILAFIICWNEYLFALSFTLDDARTVPVVVAQFEGETQYQIPWGQIMAGSIVATAPLILLVILFQNRIVSGMTSGAVKG